MRSGKVTDEQVRSLMTVFETSGTQESLLIKMIFLYLNLTFLLSCLNIGIVSSTGGVVRLRKVSDLRSSLEGVNSAFDRAIEDAHNKESPQSNTFITKLIFTI